MKPDYTREYAHNMLDQRSASVTASVDLEFKHLFEEVVSAEQFVSPDNVTQSKLAFEGLTRVIEDRLTDPTFLARITRTPEKYPLITHLLQKRADQPPLSD